MQIMTNLGAETDVISYVSAPEFTNGIYRDTSLFYPSLLCEKYHSIQSDPKYYED